MKVMTIKCPVCLHEVELNGNRIVVHRLEDGWAIPFKERTSSGYCWGSVSYVGNRKEKFSEKWICGVSRKPERLTAWWKSIIFRDRWKCLVCALSPGHDEAHYDQRWDERWDTLEEGLARTIHS